MNTNFEHPTIEITDSSTSKELIAAFKHQCEGKTDIQIVSIARGYGLMAFAHGQTTFAIYLDDVIAAITKNPGYDNQQFISHSFH